MSPDALGLTAAAQGRGNQLIVSGNTGERFRLVLKIMVDRKRKGIAALFSPLRDMKRQQRRRIADRRRTQHESAHHGKDSGVGADAEADGEYGNGGNRWMFRKRPNAVAKVTHERFEPRHTVALALRLHDLFFTAELDDGPPARFIRCQAGTKAVVNVHGDVRLEFR